MFFKKINYEKYKINVQGLYINTGIIMYNVYGAHIYIYINVY